MSLLLFDMDGTLAVSTMKVKQCMIDELIRLKKSGKYTLGIVGGGTYEHIIYQLGDNPDVKKLFTYIFSENGLVSYHNGIKIHENNLRSKWSEPIIQGIINTVLTYIVDLTLPIKRGNFIRFRNGMMYVTPIGGECSPEERKVFIEYDSNHCVREKMITHLRDEFVKKGFDDVDIRLGGAIGIGIHPRGWDKSYVMTNSFMPYFEPLSSSFSSVHFFGDRCTTNGNDYPLYSYPGVKGVSVDSPEETFNHLLSFK